MSVRLIFAHLPNQGTSAQNRLTFLFFKPFHFLNCHCALTLCSLPSRRHLEIHTDSDCITAVIFVFVLTGGWYYGGTKCQILYIQPDVCLEVTLCSLRDVKLQQLTPDGSSAVIYEWMGALFIGTMYQWAAGWLIQPNCDTVGYSVYLQGTYTLYCYSACGVFIGTVYCQWWHRAYTVDLCDLLRNQKKSVV